MKPAWRWWRRNATAPSAIERSVPTSAPGEVERLLRRLDVSVVRKLDGLRQGEHPTAAFGPGLDLADLRQYAPGDDVRSLDWNVTARTGTPHVRRFYEDRDISAWLVLDLSGSMVFGSGTETKSSRALTISGTLVRLLTARGDRVGALLYTGSPPRPQGSVRDRTDSRRAQGTTKRRIMAWFDGAPRVHRRPATRVSAGAGRTHALRLLQRAVAIARGLLRTPGHRNTPDARHPVTNLATLLDQSFATVTQRSMVVVVSDFLDISTGGGGPAADDQWARSLRGLAARHDVVGVWVHDQRELAMPDAGVVTFEDLETGEQLTVDTSQPGIREAFTTQGTARQRALFRIFTRAGGLLWPLDTSEAVVPSLVRLLETRRRMATGLRRTRMAAG